MAITPEPDDRDVLAAMEAEFTDPVVVEGVDVSALSDLDLRNLFDDTREKLYELEQMYSDLKNTFGTKDSTAEARELHSVRAACLVEMSRRGMR
jgi:hypothetical protein